jgi:hypothetical protein
VYAIISAGILSATIIVVSTAFFGFGTDLFFTAGFGLAVVLVVFGLAVFFNEAFAFEAALAFTTGLVAFFVVFFVFIFFAIFFPQ